MKKILTLVLALVLVMTFAVTSFAATNSSLPQDLYSIGAKYGMKEQDKTRMERYLNQYPLTDAQCDEILALAQQADAIMVANGTTNVKSLPYSVKAQLKALANQAASIAGVTLVFTSSTVEIYKDGVLFDVAGQGSTLSYTGNTSIALGLTAILTVALAGIVVKKKIALNA